MGNSLIIFGILLIAAGLFVNILPGMKIPILPGDIFIRKEGFTFYFPIMTSIVVSLLLTVIFGLFRK